MTIILTTAHGSHLYGTAHTGSDRDTYTVSLNGRSRQRKHGDDDRLNVDLKTFLAHVARGTPQALEALCSPVKQVHPDFAPMLAGLRPGRLEAVQTYRRTAVNFALKQGGRTGAALARAHGPERLKLRRHGLRLCLNLAQLVRTGLIQPRLDREQVQWLLATDHLSDTEFEDLFTRCLNSALMGHEVTDLFTSDFTDQDALDAVKAS